MRSPSQQQVVGGRRRGGVDDGAAESSAQRAAADSSSSRRGRGQEYSTPLQRTSGWGTCSAAVWEQQPTPDTGGNTPHRFARFLLRAPAACCSSSTPAAVAMMLPLLPLLTSGSTPAYRFLVGSANYTGEIETHAMFYLHRPSAARGDRMQLLARHAAGPNPSWVCPSPIAPRAYVCDETVDARYKGGLQAFEVGASTLARINRQAWPTVERYGPAHCAVSPSGAFVVAADWSEGDAAVFAVDGATGGLRRAVQHLTYGDNGAAHCVTFSPGEGRYVYVVDLGNQLLHAYSWVEKASSAVHLQPLPSPTVPIKEANPRHLVFHPTADYAFLITERGSMVVTLSFDAKTGVLTEGAGCRKPFQSITAKICDGVGGARHF